MVREKLVKTTMKYHYKTTVIVKLFLVMLVSTGKDTEQFKPTDFLWELKMLHIL